MPQARGRGSGVPPRVGVDNRSIELVCSDLVARLGPRVDQPIDVERERLRCLGQQVTDQRAILQLLHDFAVLKRRDCA